MTLDDVTATAAKLVHEVLGPSTLEEVAVREEDDLDGAPSLFVDIFLKPTAWPIDAETSVSLRHELGRQLRERGERRFPYMRLRDRVGESDDDPSGEASDRPHVS